MVSCLEGMVLFKIVIGNPINFLGTVTDMGFISTVIFKLCACIVYLGILEIVILINAHGTILWPCVKSLITLVFKLVVKARFLLK